LGCNIPYEGVKDLNMKITNFVKVMEIIKQIFKLSLVPSHTRIQIYKTLARPTLSDGSEAWTIRSNDERKHTSRNVLHNKDCRIHPLRTQKKQRNYEKIIEKKLERACWKNECRYDPPKF
jgi:hypothetical protein